MINAWAQLKQCLDVYLLFQLEWVWAPFLSCWGPEVQQPSFYFWPLVLVNEELVLTLMAVVYQPNPLDLHHLPDIQRMYPVCWEPFSSSLAPCKIWCAYQTQVKMEIWNLGCLLFLITLWKFAARGYTLQSYHIYSEYSDWFAGFHSLPIAFPSCSNLLHIWVWSPAWPLPLLRF